MRDIQAEVDCRNLPIRKVGIRDLRYPVKVLDKTGGYQTTTATISLSVSLAADLRGTHMSRFLEVLNLHHQELTARTLPSLLGDLKERLQAESAYAEIRFCYFVERAAPVTGATGFLDFDCGFIAETGPGGDQFRLDIRVPVTSLCPCSKAISDYGAHNQRGYVEVSVITRAPEHIVWIEDIATLVEACGSAPIYPLLKRADERHVTMQAYDRPAFVEDIARDVAGALRANNDIGWYRVSAVNQESIHNHSAYAVIEENLVEATGVPTTVRVAACA
jgi:GTP cyclohydrolase IB